MCWKAAAIVVGIPMSAATIVWCAESLLPPIGMKKKKSAIRRAVAKVLLALMALCFLAGTYVAIAEELCK